MHLIRHAESRINADKRVTGSQDVELSSFGEEQAKHLGTQLDSYYDLAFTSTLQRSRRTLEIAIESAGIRIGDILQDRRLNERSLGILEGQKSRWIREYVYGDLNYAPERGESYKRVAQRILSFLLDLAHCTSEEPLSRILISGHMGPMRIMVGLLMQEKDPATVLSLKFSNTEVIKLTWERLQIPGFLVSIPAI